MVAIDFKGPILSGEWLMVLIDYYTRYPEVKIMKSTTTRDTIRKLREIFARLGPCVELISDNGRQFCSKEFSEFLQRQGIRHRKICPLYPAANGLVERFNRSISAILEKVRGQGNWREELYAFLFAYRTTKHPNTGTSPAELFFGRRLLTRLPNCAQEPTARSTVVAMDNEKKMAMKHYADQKRKAADCDLRAGDIVLMKKRNSFKGGSRWHRSPAVVIRRHHNAIVAQRADGYMTMRNCGEFRRAAPGTTIPWYGEDDWANAERENSCADESERNNELEKGREDLVVQPRPEASTAGNAVTGDIEVATRADVQKERNCAEDGDYIRDRQTGRGLRKNPRQTSFLGY